MAHKSSQSGVALLLTLGLLSLVLVMAMSFAFTARIERMAASTDASVVRARLMAESGLERAVGFLRQEFSGDLYPGASFYQPASGEWGARGGRYLASVGYSDGGDIYAGLSSQFVVDPATAEKRDFTPEAKLHDDVGWVIMRADAEVIGRLGYLIIDESGKIDPGAVVSTTEFESSGSVTARSGSSATEICLEDSGVAFYNGFRPAAAGGLMPTYGRWYSLYHAARKLMPSQAQLQDFIKALYPHSYDIEAFRGGSPVTDKHRFNLAPADWSWDTATLWNTPAKVGCLTNAADDFWSGSAMTVPTAFDGSGGSGIPWLASLEATTDVNGDGSFDSQDHDMLRKQVCANLIDYCDQDHIPTTNTFSAGSGGWDTGRTMPSLAAPAYVGLEKVPSINEVAVEARIVNAGASTVFRVTVSVELINLYATAASGTLQIDIGYSGIPAGANPRTSSKSAEGSTYSWSVNMGASDKYEIYSSWTNYNWSGSDDVTFNVTGAVVTLTGSGYLLDFAEIGPASSVVIPRTGGAASRKADADAAVVDPRCNTSGTGTKAGGTGNWRWEGFVRRSTPNSSLGARNDIVSDPNGSDPGNKDAENVTGNDPANGLSTAYIRNGPMESLWELGCIHRGESWRTLNLNAYNDGSSAGTYANGDAQILDQVKLSAEYESRGKINVNSPVTAVWDAVLTGVKLGGDYDDPGGTGSSWLGSIASIRNAIIAASAADLFEGRGEICEVTALRDGTGGTQSTDKAQEEVIGKIVNLLTARQNYFTVLVTAQPVKDLGTISAPGAVKYDASHYCRVLAEQKILATLYRDAYRNEFVLERYEFLE